MVNHNYVEELLQVPGTCKTTEKHLLCVCNIMQYWDSFGYNKEIEVVLLGKG